MLGRLRPVTSPFDIKGRGKTGYIYKRYDADVVLEACGGGFNDQNRAYLSKFL